MEMLKLKVCGMCASRNILEVATLSPDYMGFIFFKGSKRFVGENFVIPEKFPDAIKRVGVFVNEETSTIIQLARKHSLHFIQLHGDESVEQCDDVRKSGLGVIKVFSIDENFNFEEVSRFEEVVDFILFDTKGVNRGGNGTLFNWSVLRNYNQKIPFFLSGGISAGNVDDVDQLRDMNVHAIDINSQVEISSGIKDSDLIRAIKNKMIRNGINQ